MKVKVTDGIQVTHDGKSYRGGAVVDVPDDVAAQWIAPGWVTEMPAPKKAAPRSK